MIVSDFSNNNFVVLSHLYDAKDNNGVVKTTQDEVAEHTGLSRVTINKIFVLLIQHGYIARDARHVGRYVITSIGCKVVDVFRCLSVEANNLIAKNNIAISDIF